MMSWKKIQVGAPSYLGARPLLYGMTRCPVKHVDLVYDEPATLADKLEQGQLDAALIPSIEYLRGVGAYFLMGPALLTRPGAGGLLLVSRVPLDRINRIAVNEFCRTPIAALRIVLDSLHHLLPDICVVKNAELEWQDHYDAVLMSGDRALHYLSQNHNGTEKMFDIGRMWYRLTSTPLVHSVWAYNDISLVGLLEKVLHSSRNLGISSLSVLANGLATTTPYDPEFLLDYFNDRWDYQLGTAELESLRQLEEYARRYQLTRQRRLESTVLVPEA